MLARFNRNTYLMIMISIQVGGLWAAHFKMKHMRARPGQVYPSLNPMMPTPRHPSYPSGHAIQAFLTKMTVGTAVPAMFDALHNLAERIAVNRERARVHYPSDTQASRDCVEAVYRVLTRVEGFAGISAAVTEEFRGIERLGIVPDSRHSRK